MAIEGGEPRGCQRTRTTMLATLLQLLLLLLLHPLPASSADAPPVDGELVAHRLARGQTASGEPFYSDPSPLFDTFLQQVKELEPTSEFSRESVGELHEHFIGSGDADGDVWDGWAQVCTLVEALSEIKGCLDAPSPRSGWRATHTAAMYGHLSKLAWLANMGANLDAVTGPHSKPGMLRHTAFSPAHLAALYDRVEALELLLKNGAHMHQRAPGGYTPLDLAKEKKNQRAAQWLQSVGLQNMPRDVHDDMPNNFHNNEL